MTLKYKVLLTALYAKQNKPAQSFPETTALKGYYQFSFDIAVHYPKSSFRDLMDNVRLQLTVSLTCLKRDE